jgi:hypothetical protein
VDGVADRTYRSLGMLELLHAARKQVAENAPPNAGRRGSLSTSLHGAIETLVRKMEATQPYRVDRRLCQRVLVVGGGPIGLRAACEMSLLGHHVTLMEKRDALTRLNVIKLWDASARDFSSLALDRFDTDYGASLALDPSTSGLPHCLLSAGWPVAHPAANGSRLASAANKKHHRASTSRLQLALLKAALLLGVRVLVDEAHLDELTSYQTVLVASGAKSKESVLGELGFSPGPKNAESNCIAVVAHFEYTSEWRTLADEINWVYKDAAHKTADALARMQVSDACRGHPGACTSAVPT